MSVNSIINSLNEALKETDAAVVENTKKWVLERKEAVLAFRSTEECKKMDVYSRYKRLFALAGGKGWFNHMMERSHDNLMEIVEKHCVNVAAKRNLSIAAKLEKVGVKNVISEKWTSTKDGFNGFFLVETDAGEKRIEIDTIIAGGYNIQCLHTRVLVKVLK